MTPSQIIALDAKVRFTRSLQHDLYKTGDVDAPDVIKDRNGEVVLELCRKCGKAEVELGPTCTSP